MQQVLKETFGAIPVIVIGHYHHHTQKITPFFLIKALYFMDSSDWMDGNLHRGPTFIFLRAKLTALNFNKFKNGYHVRHPTSLGPS